MHFDPMQGGEADDDIIEELADAADMIVNDCANNSPTPARYRNAYGNYQGGYGPGGGYGGSQWGRGNFRPPVPPPPPKFGSPPAPLGFGPLPDYGDYFPGSARPYRSNDFNDGPNSYRPNDFDDGPPTFSMGRGYGPYGPRGPPPSKVNRDLNHKVTKYLIRCGMGKNDLKDLPNEFYTKIEPEYCHLCGVEFDNFEMSRIHYASKNHLKTQKRWLTHFDETPRGTNKKAIPIRSREMYCELCDVEITSKVHAESHYAGKPHRSIVEGRRNPKNPVLLEDGMEGRLKQLINREKKILKKLPEPAPEAEATEKPTKEVKPTPPELYCDICNTSVTCSEQMAMHRNGKRHLSKEKNYIMRFMKGEPHPNSKKKNNRPDEQCDDDEEEAEESSQAGDKMQTEKADGNGGAAADDEWGAVVGSDAAEW